MKCTNCKKDTMRLWEGTVEVDGVTIMGRGERCSACGELSFDFEEAGRQEQAIAAAYVQRGIRTGKEFRAVRKALELKAVDIAQLLGVRPETVSRWESGEQTIPTLAAFTLAELYERPRVVRQKLEALAS